LAIASLADRLHDGFLDGLVAGVPALFHDVVVDQLVAGLGLLLAGAEAALGITARLRTGVVPAGAAGRGPRRGDGPDQADHRDKQQRSQAHPHDFASSILHVGQLGGFSGLGAGWCGTPRTPSAGPASACPGGGKRGGWSVEGEGRRKFFFALHAPRFTLHPFITGVADRAQPVQVWLSAPASTLDESRTALRLLPALRRFLKGRECGG